MSYTLNQLQMLEPQELLDIAAHDVCELSTSTTEQALIYKLGEMLEERRDMVYIDDLEDITEALPDNCFLDYILDDCDYALHTKMRKCDLIDEITKIKRKLEHIRGEQESRNAKAEEYLNAHA